MIAKPIDKIEKADIDALIVRQIAERRTIEYKLELPGGNDDAKKEFLADVSSLANGGGGDLLFGVQADDGMPTKAEGVTLDNLDAMKLKLDNIIRDGIQPRIPGVHIEGVPGFSKGHVLIVRVPQSWSSPHMITFKNWSRFYTRNSNGKYPMDVTEIRSAFVHSEALPERIRRFRDDRLAKIIAGETPSPLGDCARIVLHVVPVVALSGGGQLDSKTLASLGQRLRGLARHVTFAKFNIDGFATGFACDNYAGNDYTQLYRSGIIESVDADFLQPQEKGSLIYGVELERTTMDAVRRHLGLLAEAMVSLPVLLMLSLAGVKGYAMAESASRRSAQLPAVDRDLLLCPDVLIEDYQQDVSRIMRPVFDALWNAAGWPGSPSYDEDGNWRQQV